MSLSPAACGSASGATISSPTPSRKDGCRGLLERPGTNFHSYRKDIIDGQAGSTGMLSARFGVRRFELAK